MGAETTVRFGVVGLVMGGGHARNISCLGEEAEVRCLCDLDQERAERLAAELPGKIRCVDTLDAMCAMDDIDAVVIALPNDLHHGYTLQALASGKHVLCEKPPALTAQQTREMFDAAEEADRRLMIGLNQRFDAANAWLKTLVDAGELGEAYYAKAGWLRRRHTQPGWFTTKARSGGGPLIDLGVHLLDLTLWLMGYPEPRSVTAHVVNRLTPQVDVEDLASAFIRFGNGCAMTLEASLNLNVEKEQVYCEVCGTEGGLRTYPPAFFADRHGASVDWQPVKPGYAAPEAAGIRLLRHFIGCVWGKETPATTRDQMIALMRILEAIYRSGETGETVQL